MFRTVKRALCVVLLAFAAAGLTGCLSINAPPEKAKTDVSIGGEHGVNVNDGGKSDKK